MKLISDIINELVDTEKTIGSPLLKTKVLAHRVGSYELLEWVNKELEGYHDDDELPKYRQGLGSIIGTFTNGNRQYTNQPLPIGKLDSSTLNNLEIFKFQQGITSLESLVDSRKYADSDRIYTSLHPEVIYLINEYIRDLGNPYFQLVNAKSVISINVAVNVISVIRTKLLDFMLKIDDDFGSLTEIEELKDKVKEIDKIMQHTIITASGDGNIINTGESSKISATIKIKKGDKEALSSHLKGIGLESEDVDELLTIVENESLDDSGNFGEKTNEWIIRMLAKSLDGSWGVGVNAAGTLLADSIKAYFIGN